MSSYVQIFISLFSILNPILAVSLYINITDGFSKLEKRQVATICGITVFSILGACVLIGNGFIRILGIHTYSLQLGGGVIVLLIGISTILKPANKKVDSGKKGLESYSSSRITSLGVSPLGIPMVVGPGAIAVTLLYAQQAHTIIAKVSLLIVILIIGILVVVILRLADFISKILGEIGILVMSKIMGLFLTAIAFELIIDALQAIIPVLKA